MTSENNSRQIIGNQRRNTIGDATKSLDCKEILDWTPGKSPAVSKTTNPVPKTQKVSFIDLTFPVHIADPEKYLILPARTHGEYSYPNTAISLERRHNGLNWEDTHRALSAEWKYMPTIRQFVDFVNLLRSGNAVDGTGNPIKKEIVDATLEDIFELGNYRGRWLDAEFKVLRGKLHMNYGHHLNSQHNLVHSESKPLLPCLIESRKPGIDLDDWLTNANEQGLPADSVKKGDIWYWAPMSDNNSVTRLFADSGKAYLSCGGNPTALHSSLGVHSAQEIRETK